MTTSAVRRTRTACLDRDRQVIGQAQAPDQHDRVPGADRQGARLGVRGGTDLPREQPRAGRSALAPHLVGERHQAIGEAVRGRHGHERPAPGDPLHQAVVGEALHRVAGRHPADAELPAQVAVRRQALAGAQRGHALAQRELDLAVVREPLARMASRRRRLFRAVDGGPDRAGPGAELRRYERHVVERGDVDPAPEARPGWVLQKIKTFFSENIGVFEPVINYLLKAYDFETIDLPELKQENKKLDSTYKYQLELLYEIAQKLGFEAIYVLIDKVDETELTGNNAEKTFKLIRPLIKDLEILGLKGYGFKFFLWDQIYPYYLKDARPDRVPQFDLTWTRDELEKLLELRLQAYSNNNIPNLRQIFKENINPSPEKIVSILGWLSPRNVIRLSNEIISQQGLIDPDTNKIEMLALERASLIFSKNVANEMYGIDMLKDIQRLDTEIFTINHLYSNIFKTAHINTSRNKVTEWTKAGAIKHIGTEKKSKSQKPVYLYYLRDPRLNRIINSQDSIHEFFTKDGQHATTVILIYS